MTKRELILKLSERFKNLSLKDAELVVDTIFESMAQALEKGERIELRGFGTFQLRTRNPKQGRNPKTGEKVYVEQKRVPFFKVGKELRIRVNKKERKVEEKEEGANQ